MEMPPSTQPALVLFSHGSTLCGAAQALRDHAARLRMLPEWGTVEVGFLNYSTPRFSDVVEALVSQGVSTIVVVPYFLVAGKFVREDLAAEIAQLRERIPEVEFLVSEPIGYDGSLADILVDLATHALPPEHWRDELARSAEFCEERPDCPLYGSSPCKVKNAFREKQ